MVTKESDGLHNRSILEAGTSLLAGKAGTILQKKGPDPNKGSNQQ